MWWILWRKIYICLIFFFRKKNDISIPIPRNTTNRASFELLSRKVEIYLIEPQTLHLLRLISQRETNKEKKMVIEPTAMIQLPSGMYV